MKGLRGFKFGGGVSAVHSAGVVVCLLISAAVYGTVIGPAMARRARAITARQAVAADAQRLSSTRADVRRATGELRAIRGEIAAKAVVLSSESRLNQQLAKLASQAAECGLSTEDVRPGSVLSGGRFDTLPIKVSGRGTFIDCVKFLRRLRAEDPDVRLVAVRLSANEDGVDSAFEMTLRWYVAARTAVAAGQ